MKNAIFILLFLTSCESVYYHDFEKAVKNSHYFDFKSDSLVFLVQDGFRSDREVWKREPSIIAVGPYYKYQRFRDFKFMDNIRIGFGENEIDRIEYQKTMPLRVYSLYLLSETSNRFVLSNGSTASEMRGFYTQKQQCPSVFFSGKYIQAHHETIHTLNDSISARKTTREWYRRDSGLIYFERVTDSLKYGKLFSTRKERARRTNF